VQAKSTAKHHDAGNGTAEGGNQPKTKKEVSEMTNRLTRKESIAQLRIELKEAFPKVRFSVVNNGGTFFASASVKWTDGPTVEEVGGVVRKFETTKLDPYTDSRDQLPGTIGCLDAVLTSRNVSATAAAKGA
jgi:hypothetical protein